MGLDGAAEAFAASRGVEVTVSLEAAVRGAMDRARAAHLELALAPRVFAEYLAARSDEAGLASACVEDLYLACACLRADREALRRFETLLTQVPAWLKRPADAPVVDEVKQQLRADLLVGADASLARYQGRGALHAWLRVAALRLFWKLESRTPGVEPISDASPAAPSATRERRENPERLIAGGEVEPAVLAAIRDAFAALTSKQRALLRLRHAEGLTDEKIGAMYRVHQSTATRWLTAAHEEITAHVRRSLADALRLRGPDLESMLGAMESRMDLHLSGLLQTRAD